MDVVPHPEGDFTPEVFRRMCSRSPSEKQIALACVAKSSDDVSEELWAIVDGSVVRGLNDSFVVTSPKGSQWVCPLPVRSGIIDLSHLFAFLLFVLFNYYRNMWQS